MFELGHLRNRIHKILSDNLGTPQIGDVTGDFIVHFGSVAIFVSPSYDHAAKHLYVEVVCPLICDVKITDELCRWIAIDGQKFMYGSFLLNAVPDQEAGWVYFRYGICADDLYESELLNAVTQVAAAADTAAEELQGRFGGELFNSLLERLADS